MLDLLNQVDAADVRKANIEQNGLRFLFFQEPERLRSILGGEYGIVAFERHSQSGENAPVIIDHKNSWFRHLILPKESDPAR